MCIRDSHKIEDHKGICSKLHGHTYIVEVGVSAKKLDELNMVVEFETIEKLLLDILQMLDHKYLNEALNERNVTAEFLAYFIYRELSKRLPKNVKLVVVRVFENPNYWAEVIDSDR